MSLASSIAAKLRRPASGRWPFKRTTHSRSGTVGDVATELGRDAILVELNPVYVQMQKGRGAIGSVLNKREPETTDKPQENPGWLF